MASQADYSTVGSIASRLGQHHGQQTDQKSTLRGPVAALAEGLSEEPFSEETAPDVCGSKPDPHNPGPQG